MDVKALLIWPKFESHSFWNFESVAEMAGTKYMCPPLGMLTLAGSLPESWELRLVDENVGLVRDEDLRWCDVVLMGSKIVSRTRALALAERAKQFGKTVVVGGADATVNEAVYIASDADIVCIGEAELCVPPMLDALENPGSVQRVIRADGMADLKSSPAPRFDLLDLSDYLYVGIQYSRGCPYTCEFCNVIDIFDGYRSKTIPQVLAELDALYAAGYRGQVDFFDDNFAGNFKRAKETLRALVQWQTAHRFPFAFSTSVTLNIAKDDALLELFREARFKYFLIGIETPSPEALAKASKGQNVGFSISEAVHRIYQVAGATVHSGFLIGMDGEPDNIADLVIQCVEETSIPWVMGSIIYPLPGTGMAKRLDREQRLFPGARYGLPKTETGETVRDQISAGIQFKTERPADEVLVDVQRILKHAYDPEKYFARCADVACELNTIPVLFPGARVFFRNARTALRMVWYATSRSELRGPFWKALFRVLWNNNKGVEALFTLAVLFTHFQRMLPYCVRMLDAQQEAIREQGLEGWYAGKMAEEVENPGGLSPMPGAAAGK